MWVLNTLSNIFNYLNRPTCNRVFLILDIKPYTVPYHTENSKQYCGLYKTASTNKGLQWWLLLIKITLSGQKDKNYAMAWDTYRNNCVLWALSWETLSWNSRKATGVACDIIDGFILFRLPGSHVSMPTCTMPEPCHRHTEMECSRYECGLLSQSYFDKSVYLSGQMSTFVI